MNKNKMLIIISKINLLNKGDHEEFNKLIKEGYELWSGPEKIEEAMKNTFLVSIEDYNRITASRDSYERREFIENKIESHTKRVDNKEYILTTDQRQVYNKMLENNNYIFSMPTSFGKSMLIRMYAKKMKNNKGKVIIICPTIALLNEYNETFHKIKTLSSVSPYSSKKILILTQERALNYSFSKEDKLIVDEAYVLAANDVRAGILYNIIFKAIKLNINIKMFLPNIKNAKEIFHKPNFVKHFQIKEMFKSLSTRNVTLIERNREKWLQNINFDSKNKVAIFDQKGNFKKWAIRLSDKMPIKNDFNPQVLEIFNFLDREFGEQFKFTKHLKHGFIINHGSIPKIFRYILELLYSKCLINVIVANSTLTKGVNLKPDHIAIFANNFIIGSKTDVFELRNALGRAGRYDQKIENRIGKVEFVGEKNQFKNFEENLSKFTKDYVDSDSYKPKEGNIKKAVKDFDFNSKNNIDWISVKFKISKKEIKNLVLRSKEIFINYINYKYIKKGGQIKMFDDVWEALIDNKDLKLIFIKPFIYRPFNEEINLDSLGKKTLNYLINTCKYQGFRECLIPQKTFIKSAKIEFEYLKKKGDLYYNINTYKVSVENGKRKKLINSDMNKNEINNLLDQLIIRKVEVWGKFVESILSPLDVIIADILEIDINKENVIDKVLEDNDLSSEFKRYVQYIMKNNENEDNEMEVKKIVKNNALFKAIKYIKNNQI